MNLEHYKQVANQVITEEQKEVIKSSIAFSEEKFYRFKFGWKMIFPELNEEEIEALTWSSFIY